MWWQGSKLARAAESTVSLGERTPKGTSLLIIIIVYSSSSSSLSSSTSPTTSSSPQSLILGICNQTLAFDKVKRRINLLWALCSVQWVRWTFKRSPWGRLIDTESTLWQMWSETKTDWSHCRANRFKVVPVGLAEVTDFRRMCHKCWPNFKQPGAEDVSVVFGRSFRTRLHSSKLWALACLYAKLV